MRKVVSGKTPEPKRSSNVSQLAEASSLMREIVGEKNFLKRKFEDALTWLPSDFSYNRVRELFRADPRCFVSVQELEKIRKAAEAKRQAEEKVARREYLELLDRVSRLEALLTAQDPDMAEPQIAALRASVDRSRGMDRTMDQGVK